MKKIISVLIVVIMAASLALSTDAASIANHLFDKQGGIDAGGQTWSVYGWIVTDTEITSVGYILDGGEISSYKAVVTGIENDTRQRDDTKEGVSDAYRDLALEDAVTNGGMSGGVGWDVLRAYRIQIVIDITGFEPGKHSVLVCLEFVGGGISEAFRNQSEFTFTKSETGEEVIGGKGASTRYLIDSDDSDDSKIKATGWAGSTVKTVKLGYKIDKGETVFNDKYVQLVPLDETDTFDMAVMDLAGQYAFRFKVNFPLSELPTGYHYIKLVMIDEDGGETVVASDGGTDELMFHYETDEVEQTAAATEAATEPETAAVTEAETEAKAETENQSEAAATEPASTEAPSDNGGKGFPVWAIIVIAAAAVVAIGAAVFMIIKKKK